jgi:hypothetical protein
VAGVAVASERGRGIGVEPAQFFGHEIVERLDLRAIEDSYSGEGQPGYHPRLLLKLWLYAYCLGSTSSRRLEQRTREDLGLRLLAGSATPDYLLRPPLKGAGQGHGMLFGTAMQRH